MHLGKKSTVKAILHKLATEYTIINPIIGLTPGSPKRYLLDDNNDDEPGDSTVRGMRTWQREAACYIEGTMKRRNKFKLFCEDEMLTRIRLDRKLPHVPKSISRTSTGLKKKRDAAKDTSSSKKRKSYEPTNESDGGPGLKSKQQAFRISATRCTLCVALLGNKKAKQSMYYCGVCGVHLCTAPHEGQKNSCFEKWHGRKNLRALLKDGTVKQPTIRTSPRRKKKAVTGTVLSTTGARRSARNQKQHEV